MPLSSLTTVEPEVLGGTPVFIGTRVPVQTLFEYLEDNYSLDEFLECFPTVSRDTALRVLEQSKEARRNAVLAFREAITAYKFNLRRSVATPRKAKPSRGNVEPASGALTTPTSSMSQ